MPAEFPLKRDLRAGRPAFGCWLELFSPLAAEIVAQAGYDCVMIDLEHGPGGLMDAIALIHAVQGAGTAPLLRVPANDPVALKRALDIGLAGVMIPSVNARAEAEAAVAACRYPPRGMRGMAAPVVRASGYGADWKAYVQDADEALLVICQIESRPAVEAAAEIAAVEGVDMLFVGPFDLSASVGHLGAPDHPEVRELIAAVERAAKAAGKLLGGIPTPERGVEQLLTAGYDLLLPDMDSLMLRDAARAGLARCRKAAGD